jgi:hypothetical protein
VLRNILLPSLAGRWTPRVSTVSAIFGEGKSGAEEFFSAIFLI